MKKLLAGLLLLGAVGCTDANVPARATSALSAHGFTEINLGGRADFGECGEDDYNSVTFTALNPRGDRVSGIVCCGGTKRCTVRF